MPLQVRWLLGGLAFAFGVPFVFADLVGLQRDVYYAIYVVAVNASRSATTDTIVVPDLGDRQLVSLDGTRSVTAAGGRFTDTFAPLEVHVYVSAPTSL